MDDLLGRARAAWADYAGIDGGSRPGLVNLGVNAQSRICPPGWAGIVLLGNAAIVTAPAAGAERDLRRALSGVPMDRLTDRSAIESAMDLPGIRRSFQKIEHIVGRNAGKCSRVIQCGPRPGAGWRRW
jgi:hypothetical protein